MGTRRSTRDSGGSRRGRRGCRGSRRLGRGGLGCRRGSRCSRGGTGLDDGQQLVAGDGGAGRDLDLLQHPCHGRRHLQHDLVGFEVREVLVAGNGIAGLLVPGNQRGVGHGLGQLGYFYLGAHVLF